VYVGTSDGLNRIREGRFQLVTDKKGEPVSPISSLTQDTRGRIWFGTPTAVYRYEPGNTCPGKPVCAEDIVQQDKGAIDRMNTRVVFADSRGDVWVGTDQQGLARYHDDTVTTYTTKDGLCDNGIRGITEAADGTIWIGTKERGACLYKDGKFTPITEKDGLASDLIQGVYRGRDDSIWLQTRRGLTRRMPDGRFVTYTVAEGLYADHLYGLAEDLQGNMWMGCSRGVFRVSVKDLDAFAQGNTKRVTSIAYGIEDGLKSTVLSSGFTPSLIRSRDGRVWLATTDGMSVVDPTILKTNSIPPPVHLESVDINGASFDYTKPAQVAPGNGDLTFRYTGLSFIDPQKVHFKVRLEPYDRDWVDVENMRVKQYTNIPPGRYKFRVIAANSDGVWNEKGDGFEVNLAPHFYQTYWFYALCAAGTVLLGAGTQRWRIRNLQARERELSVRVDEAIAQIKTLRGLLPICASCKKIRDDSGYWNQMETFISDHSGADFSHSICPDCMVKLYPDYASQQQQG